MYEHQDQEEELIKWKIYLWKGEIEKNRCKESKIEKLCYFYRVRTWEGGEGGIKPEVTHADKVGKLAVIFSAVVQSRQSAKLSVQSFELAPQTPSPARVLLLPPLVPREETHSLAG
jgi:hypothetical protein